MANQFEVSLNKTLSEYSEEVNDALYKAMSTAGKKAKRDVVQNSKSDTGEYKSGWTVRTKRMKQSAEIVIYNKTHPRLTHLLENGHVIRNKYGTYGRVNGDHVIKKAQEEAEAYLLDLISKEL